MQRGEAWSFLNLMCHALWIPKGDFTPFEWRVRSSEWGIGRREVGEGARGEEGGKTLIGM